MQRRKLGKSELTVPAVSFGAWAVGGWYWGPSDDEQSVRAIQAAIDAGMNAIDTAPMYGCGHSERVVGRAIAGRRDGVVVMTKVGLRWDDTRGEFFMHTTDAQGRKLDVYRNSRPWSVRWEVEQSLKRLSVETIDLVQVHWHDPTTPIEATMGALADLLGEGKLRAIGVSNYSTKMMEEAQRALGDIPLASDQPRYSLLNRDIEPQILPFCRAHSIGVLAYSPLEQGLLTGKVTAQRTFDETDGRNKRPSFTPENRARVNALLERVVAPIARKHDATIAQIVLAWTAAQAGITSVLAGARSVEQALENARAGSIALDQSELATMRAAFEALELDLPSKGGASKLKGIVKRMLGR